MSRYEHPSYAGRVVSTRTRLPRAAPIIESTADVGLTALARAVRACCCPAQPAVVVFMPTAAGQRHPSDLLLCMHHYRVSRQQLAACGARAFSANGSPLTDDDLWS